MKKAKNKIFDIYTRSTYVFSMKENRNNVWTIVIMHSSWKQREEVFLYLPIDKTLLNQQRSTPLQLL